MPRPLLAALLALVMVTASAAAATATQKRVALVMGNSAYEHAPMLKNPTNDARDMAGALRRLDFDVIEGFDLDQDEMREMIRAFTNAIDGADVALFYYAGHGIQVHGNNYLAPVNARLERESDLDFETVQINLVLRQMEREKRTNLVFLDACRDNPLAERLARSMATRSTAIGRGLAPVESGVGMLIGYATSPGMVAFDGDGRNSPYTKALLKHIEQPNLGINDMMIKVRQDVLAESRGKQVPWEHSSLTGSFVFKRAGDATATAAGEDEAAASRVAGAGEGQLRGSDVQSQQIVSAAFQATVAVGTCGAYRAFEEMHRGTFYARLAEEWINGNCTKAGRAIAVEAAERPAGEAPKSEVSGDGAEGAPKTADAAGAARSEPAKVAAADPAPDADTQAPEKLGGEALVLTLQKELDRLGCQPGALDGKWGARTREALTRFNRYAKLSLPTSEPDAAALAALKGRSDRVCPLECGPQYDARDGRCVKKTCPSGQTLTRMGACVVVAKRAPAAAPAKAKKAPKQDEFWGGEDSRQECLRGLLTDRCFAPR